MTWDQAVTCNLLCNLSTRTSWTRILIWTHSSIHQNILHQDTNPGPLWVSQTFHSPKNNNITGHQPLEKFLRTFYYIWFPRSNILCYTKTSSDGEWSILCVMSCVHVYKHLRRWLIQSVSDPFPPNLQNIINHKP